MSKTLVIVPTYNERENLPLMAQRLLKLPVAVDLLVVDDNSPDGTGRIAGELAAQYPAIHVLHRREKNGLGRAYLAGFAWALERDYEFIMEFDGDFSHNPDDIPKFIEAAQNAELVLGSRYCGGIRVINWPLRRLLLSTAAAQYVRLITGMPFSDPTGGFKCFRRRALQSIQLDAIKSNGYSFQIEMTHRIWMSGMRVAEVPIIFTERLQGCSKMSGNIVWEALIMVWGLWIKCGFRRSPEEADGMKAHLGSARAPACGVQRPRRTQSGMSEAKASLTIRGGSSVRSEIFVANKAKEPLKLRQERYMPLLTELGFISIAQLRRCRA